MQEQTARHLIKQLNLQPHPEGGWYRETYRAAEAITAAALPNRFSGDDRYFSTAIYYSLERDDYSAFHRIKSDECWHCHGSVQNQPHTALLF